MIAMAVYHHEDPGVIVGHLPRAILRTCHYFTRHEVKISGEIMGCQAHSEEAGDKEIPSSEVRW